MKDVRDVLVQADAVAAKLAAAAHDGAKVAVGPAMYAAFSDVSQIARNAMVDATGNTELRLLGAANKVQVASEVAESMLRKAAQWLMWKAIAVISAATLSKCLFAWMAVGVEQQDLGRIAQQFDER